MAGLSFGFLMTMIVGPLSDRRGSRGLLLAYEVASAVASLATVFASDAVVLIAAATIAGFGRGANGAAGPFAPVEQAWIARETEGAARRRALSLNATIGFLGMGLGAGLVALPTLFGRPFSDPATYRLLFLLPFASSITCATLIGATREAPRGSVAALGAADPRAAQSLTMAENRDLRRLALSNAFNGLGIGLVGPLMAYWFARRFGARPDAIGPALAAGFLLAAAGSVLNERIGARIGTVGSVVRMRAVGLAAMFAMPLVARFGEAVSLYAVRAAFNQGTAGARQTVAAGLTRPERRGLAASVQTLSMQIPRAAGPVLGGWLMHANRFAAPFLIAAGLQALHLYLYRRFFSGRDAITA
ncbi:MAG: MFS transporter [Gammaproteobacteria bacterium]|nr:MFS transporter [Gammaproteobacteria bacterium]